MLKGLRKLLGKLRSILNKGHDAGLFHKGPGPK